MRKKTATAKKKNIVTDINETSFLRSEATIFINYRRDDSLDEATYLKAVLAKHFGAEKIFRDLDSIKLGAQFPEVINNTLDNASVVLVLIGKRWLTVKKEGKQRIKASGDYVRLEIETAIKLGKPILPVLLNGASWPEKTQLPASISKLSTMNCVELSWFEGAHNLSHTIEEIKELEEEKKKKQAEKRNNIGLDLSNIPSSQNKKGSGKVSIITAMELSLKRLGKNILLDAKDFGDILDHYQDAAFRKEGGFFFEDMLYIADFIGIKAKRGNKRYVARSIPLKSMADVPAQLTLKRPVICSFTVYEDWYDKKVKKTGIIDYANPKGAMQGGTVGVIISWNSASEEIKLRTPWPTWGNKGIATISKDAMYHIDKKSLRAIEAVEKTSPLSKPLLNLSDKMTTKSKKKIRK